MKESPSVTSGIGWEWHAWLQRTVREVYVNFSFKRGLLEEREWQCDNTSRSAERLSCHECLSSEWRCRPAIFEGNRERPSKATFALGPCSCMEMDLGREVGVSCVCRVGVETPFFSGCDCIFTCKVNSRGTLIGGSVTSHQGRPYFLLFFTV